MGYARSDPDSNQDNSEAARYMYELKISPAGEGGLRPLTRTPSRTTRQPATRRGSDSTGEWAGVVAGAVWWGGVAVRAVWRGVTVATLDLA